MAVEALLQSTKNALLIPLTVCSELRQDRAKKAKSKLSNRSFDTFRFKGIVFMSIFLKILISVASQTPDRQQSLKWRLQKNRHQQ